MIAALCALLLLAAQGSSTQSGLATWYDDGPGLYAAAGPDLRHGDWRGTFVTVTVVNSRGDSGERPVAVTVQLTDWCACGDRNGRPTLLDLSASAFRRLAPLSRGVIAVEVTSGSVELPPTDAAPTEEERQHE